jgi:hypothetical protein
MTIHHSDPLERQGKNERFPENPPAGEHKAIHEPAALTRGSMESR